MATDFERFTSYIARQAILTPGTLENILSIGINFKDWPEHFKSRKLLENFYKNLTAHNFKYALWQAEKENAIEILEEIYGEIKYPSDTVIIKTEYQKFLSRERAEMLSVQVANNPSDVSRFVAEFLNHQASSVEVVEFADALVAMHANHKKARAEGKQKVILPNWKILSDHIGGFNPGRLGILIADSGFGKTNLGVQLALDSSSVEPTLYFNMEMIVDDFTQRCTASMLGMKAAEFHQDWDLGRAELQARQRKLFYTTGKDLSMMELSAVARAYKSKHGIETIIVDYDQKLQLRGDVEEWKELQRASVQLETLAKELKVYILLLAQSNLDGGISGSKRSMFPASNVFLFEKGEDDTIIRVMKNRFGRRNASVKVNYNAETATVREVENYLWTDPAKRQKKEFKKSPVKTESQGLPLSSQEKPPVFYDV